MTSREAGKLPFATGGSWPYPDLPLDHRDESFSLTVSDAYSRPARAISASANSPARRGTPEYA